MAKQTVLLWLPILLWALTLVYNTYLFVNLLDMPSVYYAECFAFNGFVSILFINIVVFTWLLILASADAKLRRKLLMRCLLILTNLPIVWVYILLLKHFTNY
ncbi:hypothetical protein AM493_08025 [Flavobacterium akiainvivens]|uniref:Uncharacterized protein n=1 Tax=Flavobacterium akiainvivens TaxID=1202724 RepID=A0A0M9VHW8_9FLAO|nr:hypothetical protein [Flavobacterium akiainvivens]KOS05989.1 hypothetical protein AM493_08025 [Flavobacterium akiainvivens]SFQ53977.1 hypothetical protein SAMN05444144_10786 [Flavobacterium akiainvivens]